VFEIKKKKELGKQIISISVPEIQEGNFREEMLLNNEIDGVLSPGVRTVNGNRFYEYDIAGLSCLDEEQDGALACIKLKKVISDIARIIEASGKYLLREDDFVLRAESIFFKNKTGDVKLICVPGYNISLKNQLLEAARCFLDKIDYDDEDAIDVAYGFYMKLKENCTLKDLHEFATAPTPPQTAETEETQEPLAKDGERRDLVPEEIPDAENSPEPERREKGGIILEPDGSDDYFMKEITAEIGDESFWERARDVWRIAGTGIRIKLVATATASVLLSVALLVSGIVETNNSLLVRIVTTGLIISACGALCAFLVSRTVKPLIKQLEAKAPSPEELQGEETVLMIPGNSEKGLCLIGEGVVPIVTGSFPCVVGKEAAGCDIIVDGKGVSRRHLKFDKNPDGNISVEDLNTTNGTYLNGRKLAPNLPFPIRPGDEISFGTVVYYVNRIG